MTPEIDPPQPAGGEYPIEKLIPSFIKTYANQADFLAKTGKPAPAWNPDLPKKMWVDTRPNVGLGVVSYHTAHLDETMQHPVITDIQVPGFLATKVNIPPDSGPFEKSQQEWLTPIRDLVDGEMLCGEHDPFAPTPVAASGGLTAEQAAQLTRIERNIALIAARIGMSLTS